MPDRSSPIPDASQAKIYQIRVKGHLGPRWSDWFEDLTITPEENGDTLLTGPVVDQAALHGLLRKVRDLGLPLLSIIRIEASEDDAPDETLPREGRQETEVSA
ncbi:MAG TPA: hypothetical protein VD767_04485 [Thermomicrobiales bacterium]|nr:hypothetical protein [Thermomicrobiales bacterium]